MTAPRVYGAASIEEKFRAHTVPVAGGHLEMDGSYGLRWDGHKVSPGIVAFRIHNSRDPVGQVKPECGRGRCIEPAHVEDAPGRARLRAQLRALRGIPAPAPACRRGHDQAVHGRYQPDGGGYCNACIRFAQKAVAA